MRNIVAGLILTGCMLPVAAGAMKIANEFTRITKPHEFASLDSQPLWTSQVVRVDVSQQAYQRVPGTPMPENLFAEARGSNEGAGMLGNTASAADSHDNQGQIEVAIQEWCSARYRSYDAADNSYQPYGGGPRKPCAAPQELTSTVQQAAAEPSSPALDEHARWCSSRYNSYRAEDNTYQPFSGGRKQCNSPEIQAASNEIPNDTNELSASLN